MPATHRSPSQRPAAAALASWLLAACGALAVTPLHAQSFGQVQSPPAPAEDARGDAPAGTATDPTDSTVVGYTLYTNPDGTVMYLPRREIDIGRGTARLLQMQHSGTGRRARPIDGEQARRSYARYLKSFETDIPALYKTGVEAGARN
ncbi:Protein of uncharacterised function (DUF3613) [Delftia tsuruhatensis]|uniref:DUF3613 domain-containing protein n=1 Tax=Delftia tsuruhatensis TaxID=180282 RepID=UPI001E6D6A41|nr:DUF3613 domain-containing protein [Delftia tsuruhatensis]CAB5685162.1 Protein of uncharacterised function (DUF3613) [Delftia tsuruhatensis]CAC9690092.1 Protein of uncharacterised function (DUF3613) [Delftia tsuruhatensis]